MSAAGSPGIPRILSRPARRSATWELRAGFDAIVAAALLLFVAPLMLFVALAILFESGRPIFFSQWRLGRDGKLFRLHKFRKFHVTTAGLSGPLTLRGDCRMTRVGRFIERTKLDELPQLWDVFRGAMALVGPRPEVPDFADCFSGRYATLLRWRPGVFGPAQMAFRNEADLYPPNQDPVAFYRATLFPAKAEIDLNYYVCRSLGADALWIARCVGAVTGVAARPPPLARLPANHAAAEAWWRP